MKSKGAVNPQQDILIDMIKQTINNARQSECYLFLGEKYDIAFGKVYEKLCYTIPINLFSVNDLGFNFGGFADFCTNHPYAERRKIILRLKNKAAEYQTRLLVPIEKLNLPLLIFADSDGLTDSFMSRFEQGRVFKQSNENLKVTEFLPPNKLLSKTQIDVPYACPSLIKLGDYDNLSLADKRFDIAISRLSGNGSVYPEMLSGLQPPIKSFDDDIKLETLSLLKQRFAS